MKLEVLGKDFAERNEDRMVHDVTNAARIAHPPRPDIPISSRGSMCGEETLRDKETALFDAFDNMEAISARATTSTPPSKNANAPSSAMERVRNVVAQLDAVGPQLHMYTSREEQQRIRSYTHSADSSQSMPNQQTMMMGMAVIAIVLLLASITDSNIPNPPKFASMNAPSACHQNAVKQILKFA